MSCLPQAAFGVTVGMDVDFDRRPAIIVGLGATGVVSKLYVVLIMEELQEHLPQLRAIFGWEPQVCESI